MTGIAGSFRVPPQPLGHLCQGIEIYNYYLDWAMNKEIRSAGELD